MTLVWRFVWQCIILVKTDKAVGTYGNMLTITRWQTNSTYSVCNKSYICIQSSFFSYILFNTHAICSITGSVTWLLCTRACKDFFVPNQFIQMPYYFLCLRFTQSLRILTVWGWNNDSNKRKRFSNLQAWKKNVDR